MLLELPEFTIRETHYAPGRRMPRHAHDYSNITVVVAGEIEEATDRGRHRGRAGSVVLKPAGCEHENGVSGLGARTLSIALHRGALADEVARRSWSWLEHTPVVRAALALCRANARDAEARAHELLAAVLAVPPRGRTPPRWLAQIIATIEERFDEPIRFDALAREHGFHPVYVCRSFRQHTGMTMHEFLRGVRLRHARHLLSASKRSITAIAAASGFSDTAHLSRTFAGQFGVTPTSFRQVQSVQFARGKAS